MLRRSLALLCCLFLLLLGCDKKTESRAEITTQTLAPYSNTTTPLPSDLVWQTNDTDPEFADPAAQRGGTLRESMLSFPLTLRVTGPDSNGSFAGYTRALNMNLVDLHPNTRRPIPALATHWAFGKDHKTMYFTRTPMHAGLMASSLPQMTMCICWSLCAPNLLSRRFKMNTSLRKSPTSSNFDTATIAIVSGVANQTMNCSNKSM
ncbi:MAG: hypothetical protein R3E67_01965 [Pseudomonadales bacterium]